jgi:hypothetical protein
VIPIDAAIVQPGDSLALAASDGFRLGSTLTVARPGLFHFNTNDHHYFEQPYLQIYRFQLRQLLGQAHDSHQIGFIIGGQIRHLFIGKGSAWSKLIKHIPGAMNRLLTNIH